MALSPTLTVITLGVADMRASIAFYDKLGFKRRMKETGEEVAFFDAGSLTLALYHWDKLAADADAAIEPKPRAFRGITLAWNRSNPAEVDAAMSHAVSAGARLVKKPHETSYGGYSGYFADPDGHLWEVVCAPGIEVGADGRVQLPD